MHAIAVLEDEHPVLTYAASHWKTKQLLANKLTTKRSQARNKQTGAVPSKKSKRQYHTASSNPSSEDEDSDKSSKVSVQTGTKRKRTDTIISEPAASTAFKEMHVDDMEIGTETAPPDKQSAASTSAAMVEKRLGKQGLFCSRLR